MLYAVWAKGTNFVKIGYTASHSMNLRLSQLQIGCPHDLEVLAFADGTEIDEAALHAMLAEQHIRGEWFKWGPETGRVVEMLKATPASKPLRKAKSRNPHRRLGAALSMTYGKSIHES